MEEIIVWLTLIVDTFSICIGSLTTIIAFFVGGIITFIVQSRIQKREREWSLDNQKREFIRKQLSEQSELLEHFTLLLMHIQNMILYSGITKEDYFRKSEELWSIINIINLNFDFQLMEIFNKEFLELMKDKSVRDFDTEKISLSLSRMKMRIYKLTEETYK